MRGLGEAWEIISEAYVHGIMDGEAVGDSIQEGENLVIR
jgi:hypothetical protein